MKLEDLDDNGVNATSLILTEVDNMVITANTNVQYITDDIHKILNGFRLLYKKMSVVENDLINFILNYDEKTQANSFRDLQFMKIKDEILNKDNFEEAIKLSKKLFNTIYMELSKQTNLKKLLLKIAAKYQ